MNDVLIIGSGPAGLFAAMHASMMGMHGRVIETNSDAGGQPKYLYPQKEIENFPGEAKIKGIEIANKIYNQYKVYEQDFPITYNTELKNIVKKDRCLEVTLSNGEKVQSQSIIIATGDGKFLPNFGDFPIDNSVEVETFPRDVNKYNDKDVVILGGGDTAFDSALSLIGKTKSLTLIHRRDRFRAIGTKVDKVLKSNTNVITQDFVSKIDNKIVYLESGKEIQADNIIIAYGVKSLRNNFNLGLENKFNKILVNGNTCQSSIEGIYAVGSACTYPNKINIISIAISESVKAVNSIQKSLEIDYFLGY